jgi:hypothetical protein
MKLLKSFDDSNIIWYDTDASSKARFNFSPGCLESLGIYFNRVAVRERPFARQP